MQMFFLPAWYADHSKLGLDENENGYVASKHFYNQVDFAQSSKPEWD